MNARNVNVAALPCWANTLLLFLLFLVVPATAYLLDGPSELDAAQAVAQDKADAIADARRNAQLRDQQP